MINYDLKFRGTISAFGSTVICKLWSSKIQQWVEQLISSVLLAFFATTNKVNKP